MHFCCGFVVIQVYTKTMEFTFPSRYWESKSNLDFNPPSPHSHPPHTHTLPPHTHVLPPHTLSHGGGHEILPSSLTPSLPTLIPPSSHSHPPHTLSHGGSHEILPSSHSHPPSSHSCPPSPHSHPPHTHSHGGGHEVHAHLSTVPPHHSIVHAIEDQSDPGLHQDIRMEEEAQARENEEEEEVTKDPQHVSCLVDEEEPSVDTPTGGEGRGEERGGEVISDVIHIL